MMVNASQDIRVTNSAFRGLAAPWTSRAHMKYRGAASYEIIFQNNQPPVSPATGEIGGNTLEGQFINEKMT